jgi:antibiotic biosynthesis monooxygenase (ABM) superfamily enzyme
MTIETEKAAILTTKLAIKPDNIVDFADWQSHFNAGIAAYPGFVSLEILSPVLPEQPKWLLVQRFYSSQDLANWRQSEIRHDFMAKLEKYLVSKDTFEEVISTNAGIQGGITEVFITQVVPENEKAFRKWIAKIHCAEAKFPGFRGVYVQSPTPGSSANWITLLQFDTPEHLDCWLNSPERQKVLSEAQALISVMESHRMISPYAGWFASIAQTAVLPPVWKQTMLVLLVLFPIVVFELKYLGLLTEGLNPSLGTFIGNAISVSLISWPMMPIALSFLGWWLIPKAEHSRRDTLVGLLIVIVLYLIEIALFWNFL